MTNREIVEKYLENGLIDRCLEYQFKNQCKQYREDYKHDLIIELLEYPRLQQVEESGHMNAFLTRCIQNNIYSKSSWYYRRYIRFDRITDEITERERNLADGQGL